MARTVRTPGVGGSTNGAPSHGGTFGGLKAAVGPSPGRKQLVFGDEVYLWILVAIEVTLISWARSAFSRYHGG